MPNHMRNLFFSIEEMSHYACYELYQRLSSGLRINSASDDPAGLSLSSKISTDARIVGDIFFPPRNWEHRLQRERERERER